MSAEVKTEVIERRLLDLAVELGLARSSTTGSGIERWMACRVSSVLERAFDEVGSEWAQRGRASHAFLQHVGEGMPAAEALDLVDEEHREACRAIDLEDLRDVLGLTAELSLAYNPTTDTARVLGVALDREYAAAGVTEDEIPLTVDVAGLDDPKSPSVGVVYDYKTGWSRRTPAERNWQMRGGALALARAFDLSIVRVQLIHLHENRAAYRDRASFDAADFAMFAAEARVRRELELADREHLRATGERPDATQGAWCNHCPSYHACPAKANLVRTILGETEIETRIAALTDPELALAWKKARQAKQVLERIESSIFGIASQRPVLLERRGDGTEEWLGMTPKVGNLKIDADKARDVVRQMLDEAAVDEVSKYTVTQGLIEDAIKKRVPRGQGAAKMRAVLEEMKRTGAATKPTKHEVGIYTIQRALKAG